MSVHLDKCTNDLCGHLFEVEQFSKTFGNGIVNGMIECPYCGLWKEGDPKLVYISRKLTKQLEEWCAVDRDTGSACTLPLRNKQTKPFL
jgi:hypothetical protein